MVVMMVIARVDRCQCCFFGAYVVNYAVAYVVSVVLVWGVVMV